MRLRISVCLCVSSFISIAVKYQVLLLYTVLGIFQGNIFIKRTHHRSAPVLPFCRAVSAVSAFYLVITRCNLMSFDLCGVLLI